MINGLLLSTVLYTLYALVILLGDHYQLLLLLPLSD
jgi:hypothetical protein